MRLTTKKKATKLNPTMKTVLEKSEEQNVFPGPRK